MSVEESYEGLDRAEELVLSPLEDSPMLLWELRLNDAASPRQTADLLAPGLVSLVRRGLVEVRRFGTWPPQWEEGVPVAGDDLVRESGRAAAWSDNTARSRLAAHITKAGIRYL
jgi:hypothetical protein